MRPRFRFGFPCISLIIRGTRIHGKQVQVPEKDEEGVEARAFQPRRFRGSIWIVCALPLVVGCDPILDIDGAFFPGWMLCLIVGIGLAFAFHPLFVRMGIADHLGPPVLIYPSLALLLTLTTWLVFFHT